MRRFYSSLTILGLMGAIAGCHTAGACDCAGPGSPCCYGSVGMPLAPTQWAPVATFAPGDPARAMPKAEMAAPAAPEKISAPADSGK
jgi:hypothetical protein